MKKIITIMLTLSLLLCPLGVSAESPQSVTIPLDIKLMSKGEFPKNPSGDEKYFQITVQHYNSAAGASAKELQDINEYVRDCMTECMTEIPLSDYNIICNKDDVGNYLSNLLNNVTNYYAELFHVNGFSAGKDNLEYTDSTYTQIWVKSVSVTYNMTKTEYDTALKTYNGKIDNIISGITPDMTDLEKALYVHDYLVTHFQYDPRGYSEDEEIRKSAYRDAYSFFKTGEGVCQAYTQAFNGIMHRLGIKCTSALNNTDNHTWNIITLNGKNYHIDVTHDDPSGQSAGAAKHGLFLLSDESIIKKDKHTEWYSIMYDTDCTDKTYESRYAWNDAGSSFEYVDGKWYYIKPINYTESSLFSTKDFISYETIVNGFNTTFPVPNNPGSIYVGYTGGITAVGSSVYYSAPDSTIYSYNTKTGEVSNISVSSETEINTVTSCRYDGDGILTIFFGSTPSSYDDGGYVSKQLFNIGDTDGDGKVNGTDIINLKKYLLGAETDFNWATVDFSNKRQVNILDLIKIKKLAA